MHSGSAYTVLAETLSAWQMKPGPELVRMVSAPPFAFELELEGQRVEVEVRVTWDNAAKTVVLIEATAYGPSTWATQRASEKARVKIAFEEGASAV